MSAENWRDDPRVGDVIVLRVGPRRRTRPAREIIGVRGDRIETMGMGGRDRNSTMGRDRLAAYDLLRRGP